MEVEEAGAHARCRVRSKSRPQSSVGSAMGSISLGLRLCEARLDERDGRLGQKGAEEDGEGDEEQLLAFGERRRPPRTVLADVVVDEGLGRGGGREVRGRKSRQTRSLTIETVMGRVAAERSAA